jgi:hypothetical protein
MKFSSKLALVAAASFLSVSAFADVPADLAVDTLKGSMITDMAISALSDDGGAYILQTSAVGGSAVIQQDNSAGGNWAYINQANATAPSEAMITQSGAGNAAAIFQK